MPAAEHINDPSQPREWRNYYGRSYRRPSQMYLQADAKESIQKLLATPMAGVAPLGWRAIAFRNPKPLEWYVLHYRCIHQRPIDQPIWYGDDPRIIVVPK